MAVPDNQKTSIGSILAVVLLAGTIWKYMTVAPALNKAKEAEVAAMKARQERDQKLIDMERTVERARQSLARLKALQKGQTRPTTGPATLSATQPAGAPGATLDADAPDGDAVP